MKTFFSFREQYRQYAQDCVKSFETPPSFRDWFETTFYYDMADQMPTGQAKDISFTTYKNAV